MSKEENPQAFPHFVFGGHTDLESKEIITYPVATGGMTLRDYFAGQVLISITNDLKKLPDEDVVLVPALAYSIADAMLKERSKK